jgi:exonuclease SbcC
MIELVSLHSKGFKKLDLEEPISFPKGSLLIYGLNESGKSTIMEAIHFGLFGIPLRPSKNAAVEDYLNYSMDTGFVHLVFRIDGTEYRVKRTIKRNGVNVHELDIKHPDGKTESLTAARAVNSRIIDDLNGINSDALLNSCMVEQKALGKLESSSRQERIKAITLLLNLEAFTASEGELKSLKKAKNISLQETSLDLEKWKARKEEYERAVAEKERAERKLEDSKKELPKVVGLIEKLKEKLDAISKVKGLKSEVETLEERERAFITKVEELKENLEEIKRAKDALQESRRKLPGIEAAFNEAEVKVKALESLLKLDGERKELSNGITNLKEKIAVAEGDVKESKEASETVRELKKEYELQKGVLEAEKFVEKITTLVGESSKEKELVEREGSEIEELEHRLASMKDVEEKISDAEGQIRDLESKKDAAIRNRSLGYGVGGGGAVLGLVLGLIVSPALFIFSVMSLVLGAYLVVRSDVKTIASKLENQKGFLSEMLGAKSNIGEYRERLAEKTSLVEESRERIKSCTDSLLEVIKSLPKKPRTYRTLFNLKDIEGSQHVFLKAIQEDREKLKEIETLLSQVSQTADLLSEREDRLAALLPQMKEKEEHLQELESRIRISQDEFQVTIDMEESVRQEKENLGSEVSRLKQKIEGLEETVAKEKELANAISETKTRLTKTKESIKENLDKIEVIQDKHGVTMDMEERLTEDRDEQIKRKGELENSIRESQEAIEEAEEIIEENKGAPEKYREIEEQLESLEFDVTSLDRAVKIINTTRDGIVGGVKERIEAHMMRFLPLLTAGRYSMAKIDEKEYKVEVYDKEARRWRMKGVFSGATQDQFSLALRLAFALSTLPTSRGVVPGFIFLDEPLSGFDDERRKGLLQLLTKGDIASQFEQIVVISHGSQLRGEFPSRLHMEKGKVVEKVFAE